MVGSTTAHAPEEAMAATPAGETSSRWEMDTGREGGEQREAPISGEKKMKICRLLGDSHCSQFSSPTETLSIE